MPRHHHRRRGDTSADASAVPSLPPRRVTITLPSADAICEHCEQLPAQRTIRGLGPICAPCFTRSTALSTHPRERPLPCGCTSIKEGCPFAQALRRRIRSVESRALDLRGQDGAEHYWRIHTQLVLAIRRHQHERQKSAGVF